MMDSWSAKSCGSSGNTEAGADIRFRPCSASRRWTIFTGSIPVAFPPFRQRSSADWGSSDQLYFDRGKGNYLGCLMDGGVWDTILAAQALAQAGEKSDPLILAAEQSL